MGHAAGSEAPVLAHFMERARQAGRICEAIDATPVPPDDGAVTAPREAAVG